MSNLIIDHPALSLFSELLSVPSPSGREERVAGLIRRRLSGWGYEPATDASGNVLVRLPGRNPTAGLCIMAAHMDEIGMVVTRIEADGALRVDRTGGLYPYKIGEGPVQIVGDGEPIVGLLSMGSTHVAGAADQVLKWKDVRIITGRTPEQLRTAGVRVGSTAVPVRSHCGPFVLGEGDDPLVAAWTFDDRMGCVAELRLLEAMAQEKLRPFHPTIVAFTVHEEGGGNGAKALAFRERPETFIAVDGSPITPGSPLQLDGRPGIWSKDRLAHFDQRLLGVLMESAVAAGTELQPAVFDSAASDASMVAAVGSAQRIAGLGPVRENSHGYEVARLSCFDNVFKTLLQFTKTWED